MTGVGLLGALGSTIVLIGFLFWQARRAAKAADGELAATKLAGDLELQLAARGRAIEDRDKIIDTLKANEKRLEAALLEALAQRDSLVANIKDPHAAVSAIRDALGAPPGVPMPNVPKTPGPSTR